MRPDSCMSDRITFSGSWIFIIGQTTGASSWLWSLRTVTGLDCWASVKCQSQTAPLAPGGQRRSPPASHQQGGHQKQSDRTSSRNVLWLGQRRSLPDAPHYRHSQKHSCVCVWGVSCAGNNGCFLTFFLKGFVMRHSLYTSSFLRSVDTARADWNLMLLLTSASPAVIVPLLIITAGEEEKGWVAQTPCLPPLSAALHTALMCSDTTAQTPLLPLLPHWPHGSSFQNSFIYTPSHTHNVHTVHGRLGVARGSSLNYAPTRLAFLVFLHTRKDTVSQKCVNQK